MRVLLIGGTGLISTGIVKHLAARSDDMEITMFNRGQRENTLAASVRHVAGHRNDFATFEKMFASEKFDVVIDMICFSPAQAEASVRAFSAQCEHFIFGIAEHGDGTVNAFHHARAGLRNFVDRTNHAPAAHLLP